MISEPVLLIVDNLFDVLVNRDVYQLYTNISVDQALTGPPGLSNFLHNELSPVLLLNSNEQNSYGSHRPILKIV